MTLRKFEDNLNAFSEGKFIPLSFEIVPTQTTDVFALNAILENQNRVQLATSNDRAQLEAFIKDLPKPDGTPLTTAEHTAAHADKIKTYKKLSEEQVTAINHCKNMEEELAALFEGLYDNVDLDIRWVSIARTDFEKGFMSLIRAIAQPATPFEPNK